MSGQIDKLGVGRKIILLQAPSSPKKVFVCRGAADMAAWDLLDVLESRYKVSSKKNRGLKALSHKAGTKERDWSWRPGENRCFSAWQSVSRNASFPFGFPLNAKQKKSTI